MWPPPVLGCAYMDLQGVVKILWKFGLCVLVLQKTMSDFFPHPNKLYMERNRDFFVPFVSFFIFTNKWTELGGRKHRCEGWCRFILNMVMFGVTSFSLRDAADWRVYHVTGRQGMVIDSIVFCPWSCINQEALSSVPDGFREVVFFIFPSVVMSRDGAKRGQKKKRVCEIPKSVEALHQSADALILTTDLFHLADSARPIQNHALKTRSSTAPESFSGPPGQPRGGDNRSRGWRPAWCNQNQVHNRYDDWKG